MAIPDVPRDKLIEAMHRFDRDFGSFGAWWAQERTGGQLYAVQFEGRLYPPKRIIEEATGLSFTEFRGGVRHANPYLEERNFLVVKLAANGQPTAGKVFGEIAGVPEGAEFESRKELAAAGVHRPLMAGISGSGTDGAESIVLSGGYEDDHDEGDTIVYTGHGGRDGETGRQVSDQRLERGNLALATNQLRGLPVRVVRGAAHASPYSPVAGYRYDGLYRVEDHWHEVGRSGFRVWRFRLVKLPASTTPGTAAPDGP